MFKRILVGVSVLALVAVLGCGGGGPGCDSAEVEADIVATSAANPWYSSGVLIVGVEEGRESGRQPLDGGKNCAGVAVLEDDSRWPMEFNISYGDDGGLSGVGFDYEGRVSIPKSEWDRGRRE